MIYYLRGEVTDKGSDFVVVDVNGVGYKVFVSEETKENLKGKITLFCFTHFTGKALKLYGLEDKDNLSFFEDLMKMSGIGPKSALSLASIAPMKKLKVAIEKKDKAVMEKILKIGKKKGERVIFELSGKYIKIEKDETFKALKGLGFEGKEIEDALSRVSGKKSKEERVKEALKILGR